MSDRDHRPLRLSELARRVINAAQALAEADAGLSAETREAGAVHVLLALAQEQRSLSAALLRECHLDVPGFAAAAARLNGAAPRGLDGLLERAYAQAERLGSHYTGTEHLLLALSYDPGMAALLTDYGTNVGALCQHLERHLAG